MVVNLLLEAHCSRPQALALATKRWTAQLRADRRAAVREQLAGLRDEIASLEDRRKLARKRRTVLVTRILGWDGERDTGSALGRDAGLSHTAVRTLRTALEADQEDRSEDEGARWPACSGDLNPQGQGRVRRAGGTAGPVKYAAPAVIRPDCGRHPCEGTTRDGAGAGRGLSSSPRGRERRGRL
ncbi:hypothetical protein [Streptomyces hydrogenans]